MHMFEFQIPSKVKSIFLGNHIIAVYLINTTSATNGLLQDAR